MTETETESTGHAHTRLLSLSPSSTIPAELTHAYTCTSVTGGGAPRGVRTKWARSRGNEVGSGGTRKRGWVVWQLMRVCCERRLRHMRQPCRRGPPRVIHRRRPRIWSGSVCVVHSGHTRTSWPPTWCALPVGGGAWPAARWWRISAERASKRMRFERN